MVKYKCTRQSCRWHIKVKCLEVIGLTENYSFVYYADSKRTIP